MAFESFDDYWIPFLAGVSAASSYTEKLNQEERDALEERLREKIIGGEGDQPIKLLVQAWAIKGYAPSD